MTPKLDNPYLDLFVRLGLGRDVAYTAVHLLGPDGEGAVADETEALREYLVGPEFAGDAELGEYLRGYRLLADRSPGFVSDTLLRYAARRALVVKYAWAVPTAGAVRAVAAVSPRGVVEVGAGTGYWAWLLRQAGVDVVAYDSEPGQSAHYRRGRPAELYHDVRVGGPEVLRDGGHADRTLLLVWPPYDDPMGADCLAAYRGDAVVYVGEDGGCTGDARMHELLAEHWTEVEPDDRDGWWLPTYPGIHDRVITYRRK